MNIFVLDTDIVKNAQYHCDKHVVKMILEAAQIASSVHWMSGGSAPYKLTHKNSEPSIWARRSLSNYVWLISFGFELCKEYTFRYKKTHKTQKVFEWLESHLPNIPDIGLTEFAIVVDKYDEYRIGNDVVASYRNYYAKVKDKALSKGKKMALWERGRPKPDWINV